MLYDSECWALTTAEVQRLQQNEHAMIRWICKVKISDISDKISSDCLLNKLCLKNLDITLQTNHSCDCNWTRTHNHLVHKRTLNHLLNVECLFMN